MPITMTWMLPPSILLVTLLLTWARLAAAQQQNGSSVQQQKITDVPPHKYRPEGALNGELMLWHKVTIGFEGPPTNETHSTNPFTDYRLDVTFMHPASNKAYVVPGYYACDGNAANSGADTGPVWLTHFAPSSVGTWYWNASFVTGTNVAMNGGGTSAFYMDGATGSFEVDMTDKKGRDHRGKGLLEYVGEHYLRFAQTREYFLKSGPDSPENFLAYEDFDNTENIPGKNLLKTWNPHKGDATALDPTWSGGKGTGIMGAINYLSNKGMNSFSFLTLTLNGKDGSVFPYISPNAPDFVRMDCSKLAQWEVVFEHADRMGMFMHFKTQEEDNHQLLNNGELGDERKLYYRELIARFSHHLALNWNLGERQFSVNGEEIKQFSDFFKDVDPYDHPVVVRANPALEAQQMVYGPLLGYSSYHGVSLRTPPELALNNTLYWVKESAAAGRKWIVSFDEQTSDDEGVEPDMNGTAHALTRKESLWGNIMAGGAGVEYFFSYKFPNSDLTLQDFRSRDLMWDQNRHALDFFSVNRIPFWNMINANSRLSGTNWCMAHTHGDVLVVYLRNGGSDSIDLSDSNSSYLVQWFDPRNGGGLQLGSKQVLPPKQIQSLGKAPDNPGLDWVVLLRCTDCSPDAESTTGLIAGWAVAGLFVVAIGLLVVERLWPRCHCKKTSSSDFSAGDIGRGQDPPTASNESANRAEFSASYHRATVLGQAIPLIAVQEEEEEGSQYADQVAPNAQYLESDLIPTAAAIALGEDTVEAETEAVSESFRVVL